MVGNDSLQAAYLAEQRRDLGFANAAIVSEAKAVSKGLADQFDAEFAALGGTTSVRKTVPDGATAEQFSDFLTIAAQARPDFVFFGGEYNVAAVLRAAAFERGLVVPLMGGDGMNDPAYVSGAGFASGDSYASGVGLPLETLAGADEFLAAYRAAGNTSDPTDYGPYAYDAANSVIDVLAEQLEGQEVAPVERARRGGVRPAGNGPGRAHRSGRVRRVRRPARPAVHALPRRRLAVELDRPPGRLSRRRRSGTEPASPFGHGAGVAVRARSRRRRSGTEPASRARHGAGYRGGRAVDRVAVDVDDHAAPILVVSPLELVHTLPVRPHRVRQRGTVDRRRRRSAHRSRPRSRSRSGAGSRDRRRPRQGRGCPSTGCCRTLRDTRGRSTPSPSRSRSAVPRRNTTRHADTPPCRSTRDPTMRSRAPRRHCPRRRPRRDLGSPPRTDRPGSSWSRRAGCTAPAGRPTTGATPSPEPPRSTPSCRRDSAARTRGSRRRCRRRRS